VQRALLFILVGLVSLLSGVARADENAVLEGAPLEELTLDDGAKVWVALPIGAKEKRPVIVGVHGAGDRPDWACTEWQQVTASHAFVICPRGITHPTDPKAFVWSSAEQIAKSSDRAVAAARAKYGAWMMDGAMTYGAWSQGATLAADVVGARPGLYERVVLVEVGHTPVDASAMAARFTAAGVQRAVVACESWNCRTFAASFTPAAQRRWLPTKTVDAGLRPHWFDEPMYRALAPSFAWMFEDEAKYAGLGAAIDARWLTD
jgi:hypothetical protein